MIAVNLRTENLKNPLGIDLQNPRLTWRCEDGLGQTAYELRAESDGIEIAHMSAETSEMAAVLSVPLHSAQRVAWSVRLTDENGVAGPWSKAWFEMGLLDPSDWKAQWIDPEHTADGASVFCTDETDAVKEDGSPEEGSAESPYAHLAEDLPADVKASLPKDLPNGAASLMPSADKPDYGPHRPASWLRKTFVLPADAAGDARLYITAHGLYEAWLNGQRVGEDVLTPGTGNYDYHVPYQTYDISGLLREGENELLVQVGDGWYRGCSGTDGERNLYGEDIALLAQVKAGGKILAVTDGSWEATQDGPLRTNDLMMGETYDARIDAPFRASGKERMSWHGVLVAEDPKKPLFCTNEVPIREKERFAGTLITTPDGKTVIDFGQNLAGYVEFTLNAHEGDVLTLWHGETLDENGNFTQENFQDRNRHKEGGVDQKVTFICREGENHYKTTFSIWGFRYALVETDIDLTAADAAFTAIAVYSDMDETAFFACGNADVNQLFSNALWSMKGNFCDIPTDCPTRERAGWTGDAGLFVETGLSLMDCASVYRKWLGEVRLLQQPDGKVMNIAPRNNNPNFFSQMLSGSTGWGDAVILIPYAIWQRTGDTRILEENYELMQRWYAYLTERAKQDDPRVPMDADDPYREYTVTAGIDYGEWCEPGTNSQMAMAQSNYPVATAYFAYSGRMLSEIASVLGKDEDAARYADTAEKARIALRRITTEDGVITSEKEADYIRPLAFGLMDEADAARAAADLAALVEELDFHLNTGFLSTPHLCPVLADHGYVRTAYRVLLQDTCPGWLYEIRKGATTVWETWDGIREDGTVHDSLNHYSYGSIAGWLISGVCGIRVSAAREEAPVVIAPHPDPLLSFASAAYDSPFGRIESGWTYDGDDVRYTFAVPANVRARVILPDGRTADIGPGKCEM